MNDDLLLIELERLRQMLRIAAVDVARFSGCDAGDYLHIDKPVYAIHLTDVSKGGVIMFEKDEDYRKAKSKCKARITKAIKVWNGREEAIRDASFEDGAEFGYNKANKRV
jgi:hypothetical protein